MTFRRIITIILSILFFGLLTGFSLQSVDKVTIYSEKRITHAGGQIFQVGDFVTIVIPTDQLFDTNSAELLSGAPPILQSAAAVLERQGSNNILISGNSSGFGTRKYELEITEKRAREVAAFFWANTNISNFQDQSILTRKLIYTGYGNYFPIANNIKAKSIRQNSRIQITSYPTSLHLELDPHCKVFNNIGGLES